MIRSCILLCIACVIGSVDAAFSPAVRPDAHIDQTIIRMAARHGIEPPYTLFCQPMQAADVLGFLDRVDSLSDRGLLSREESAAAHALRIRLEGRKTRLKWQDSERDLSVFAEFKFPGTLRYHHAPDNAITARGIINPMLQGNIAALSYYAELDVWTDYRSDSLFDFPSYQPFEGVPYNLYGRARQSHFRSSDLPRGGVIYSGRLVSLGSSIDYLRQGPTVYNPVTLSDEIPPVTYARAWMNMGPARYIHTVGMLKFQKDKPKYLYTHRLHIPLPGRLGSVGINEVIVNGSTVDSLFLEEPIREAYRHETRTIEWTYLIPFVPFKFTEHYNGDRDNAAISLDVNFFWPTRFRWYGELFIDDMLDPVRFWTDDWGNKLAYTVGTQYFGGTWGKDLTATLEYCRVEPWVYTHFYGGSHRYSHYDKPLGARLGPNSHQLNAAAFLQLTPKNAVGISYVYTAQNPSVRGGSINHIFQDFVDSETKRFLGPGTIRSHQSAATWTFDPFGVFRLDLLAGYHSRHSLIIEASGGLHF